ncbi:MAG: hypothetical protein JSW62_04795 [Thermoplasmatales archaeon]|nr:MAG: hypothetical protein JSW62_04795 [Thermoplasmatales archaeon]
MIINNLDITYSPEEEKLIKRFGQANMNLNYSETPSYILSAYLMVLINKLENNKRINRVNQLSKDQLDTALLDYSNKYNFVFEDSKVEDPIF